MLLVLVFNSQDLAGIVRDPVAARIFYLPDAVGHNHYYARGACLFSVEKACWVPACAPGPNAGEAEVVAAVCDRRMNFLLFLRRS